MEEHPDEEFVHVCELGYEAAVAGWDAAQNPYAEGTEAAAAWQRGFDAWFASID